MQIKNRNSLFWIFNISGWFLFFGLDVALNFSSYAELSSVLNLFALFLFAVLLSSVMRIIYRKRMPDNFKIRRIILLIVVVSLGASFLRLIFSLLVESYFCTTSDFTNNLKENIAIISTNARIFKRTFQMAYPLLIWSLMYVALKMWFELIIEKERREKAFLLAQQAELKMLRYQLNPHFLFNSLNSIQALIFENQQMADKMLTELSEFLRYTLSHVNKTYVPFKDELDAVQRYLTIEKIRYEEKLEYSVQFSEEAGRYQVLRFLIQPLIENAVKHGIKTSAIPLKINIKGTVTHNTLHIEISNTGRLLQTENEGTGIPNLKERLENAYENRHSFKMFESDGSVSVQLAIEHQDNSI
jgi:LytS/YehU family sensor histidine kinase